MAAEAIGGFQPPWSVGGGWPGPLPSRQEGRGGGWRAAGRNSKRNPENTKHIGGWPAENANACTGGREGGRKLFKVLVVQV